MTIPNDINISGSDPSFYKFIQSLHDRFLNSAQEIMCNREAAMAVTEVALKRWNTEYHRHSGKPPREVSMIQWMQDVLDLEIDSYFHGMLHQIRNRDRNTEKKLLTMIDKKFIKNIHSKISMDPVHWDSCDVEDVVSEAKSIVSTRYLETEFKGLFIQWVQAILNNKYRERRRQKIRQMLREKKIEDESYEKKYSQRLSDVVEKRRETEVHPEEAEKTRKDYPVQDSIDPFEGDLHYFEPDILIEGNDLKERLLVLVKRIKRKACAKVFRVLFSEGDRKFMAEQFPNHTKQQIDLLVSQCRKQLKLEAEHLGVL